MRGPGREAARTPRPLALAAALLVAASTWTETAPAQQTPPNKAAAEALFEQGKALYESGNYEQACAKFAASQELDAGFGTLMNLGECYEKSKKTASAWATFKEAASLAQAQGQSDRASVARDRATALEARLSTLVVHVAEDVSTLPGLSIQLNGTPLPRAVWGSPVPVDPGSQRLVLNAPGYRAFARDLSVAEGKGSLRVDVPALEREVTSAPPPTAVTPASETAPPPAPMAGRGGEAQRTIGFVTGGVGLAAIVVGSIFGARAFSKNSASKAADVCRTENFCTPTGLTLRDDARDAARVSTIAFVAGGVLLAAGVTLVLVAPPRTEAGLARRSGSLALPSRVELRSVVGSERAGLELRGAW